MQIVPGRGIPGVCELGMTPEKVQSLNPDAHINKDRSFIIIPHAGITVSCGQLPHKDATVITFNFKRCKMVEWCFLQEYGENCKRFSAIEVFPGMFPPFHGPKEITFENVQEKYGVHAFTFSSRAEFFHHLRTSNSLSPAVIRLKENDLFMLEYPQLGFNVLWKGTDSSVESIQVYRPLDKVKTS